MSAVCAREKGLQPHRERLSFQKYVHLVYSLAVPKNASVPYVRVMMPHRKTDISPKGIAWNLSWPES